MSPIGHGTAGGPDWLDPGGPWSSPYRVRRSSYVIATQELRPSSAVVQPELATTSAVKFPLLGRRDDPSPIYDLDRRRTTLERDFDLPGLLTLPLSPPGEPWTPTSAESSSLMPTPRHWDSLPLDDDRLPKELDISSPDCLTSFGTVGNHVNYSSSRNALLMISAGENDAITTVEGDDGWCNACRVEPKVPETEADTKTTSEHAQQPVNAVRNLVVVCLSCVLVLSGFRSAECLESTLNDWGRLGVVSLSLMHAAAAGTCFVAPVMVCRLGAKWTMFAGAAFYIVWLAANCAPHPCTMLPAAASVGLGESLLWTAQVSVQQIEHGNSAKK